MAGRKDKDVCQSSTERSAAKWEKWEEEVKKKSGFRYHNYPLTLVSIVTGRYHFPYTDRKLHVNSV